MTACSQALARGLLGRRVALETNRRKIKASSEELTCSFAGAAAAAAEGGVIAAAETSASLFLASNLVNVFGAAVVGLGALGVFSFSTSGPEFTDGADPVFAFLAGGALGSSSLSLKHQRYIIIGI